MSHSIAASVFRRSIVLLVSAGSLAWAQSEQPHPPIIDMHLHAYKVADFGVGLGASPAVCSTNEGKVNYGWDPQTPFQMGKAVSCSGTRLPAPTSDEQLMRDTLQLL